MTLMLEANTTRTHLPRCHSCNTVWTLRNALSTVPKRFSEAELAELTARTEYESDTRSGTGGGTRVVVPTPGHHQIATYRVAYRVRYPNQ